MSRKHRRIRAKAKRLALKGARRMNRTCRIVEQKNNVKPAFVGVVRTFEVNGVKFGPGALFSFER